MPYVWPEDWIFLCKGMQLDVVYPRHLLPHDPLDGVAS